MNFVSLFVCKSAATVASKQGTRHKIKSEDDTSGERINNEQ